MQEPQNLQDWLDWSRQAFREHGLFFGHGTDNPEDEAMYLIRYVLNRDFEVACLNPKRNLTAEQNRQIHALFQKRITSRKPAAYLVHEAWFAGYPFYVDERVLVPRSPLAELILEQFSPWMDAEKINSILDIGTGSACIAIACALTLPHCRVDAVDIQEGALEVARMNIANHRLESRVHLFKADIYNGLPPARYDIIISNPPYVSIEEMQSLPAEYRHEPPTGLVAGVDGLECVRKILFGAKDYLSPDGILVVEVGNSQLAVEQAWPQVPFVWLEFEYGGEGVFLLEAKHVYEFHDQFTLKASA